MGKSIFMSFTARRTLSTSHIQEAGIDLLDGAERGVRPRLGRGHFGLSCLAGLCASGADHAERGGSNGRSRGAQESAAMMVDVFGHLSAPVRIKWMAPCGRPRRPCPRVRTR